MKSLLYSSVELQRCNSMNISVVELFIVAK